MTHPTRLGGQRANRRHGATAVEFAITVPILFFIVFAAIEFSRLYMIRNTAENAAYEGARRAIVPGGTAQDAIQTAHNVVDVVFTKGEQVTVEPATITPYTEEVTVTVEIPFDQNGWVFPRFLANKTIVTTCTLQRDLVETSSVP